MMEPCKGGGAALTGDGGFAETGATVRSEPAAKGRCGQLVEIFPPRGWSLLDIRELWNYRELVWVLAQRDIRARYKQSVFGIAWVVAPPLITMVIFSVVFGILMGANKRPSIPGVPYAVSTYCALVVWQLFASSLRNASSSLIQNRNLILKVYFPRIIILIAPVLAGLFDFLVSLAVCVVLISGYVISGKYTFHPGAHFLFLPVFVALAAVTAFAASIWIAGLGAVYRDFNLFGPISIQLLMYATPVLYTFHAVAPALGETGRFLYTLNPMVGVVEGFRWAILGFGSMPWQPLTSTCVLDLVLLVGGLLMFRRIESLIVDVL